MANRCASLDATWAHLPARSPSPWEHHPSLLSPAAFSFEDGALTAALRASMSSLSYCSAASPTPSSSTTTTTSDVLAPAVKQAAARRGPPGRSQARPTGRLSKRKPRLSRRAQTTYIKVDPANFSRMVQEITGFPVPGAFASDAASYSPAPLPAALAYVLPTLDTSAFFLDSAQPLKRDEKTTGGAPTMAMAADESLLLRELEAMVSAPAMACAFPTLESWGMI